MTVLINVATGLAENVPDEQAQQVAQAGTHEVPLNDPDGNPVTASYDNAQNLISQGYTQPSPHQLNNLMTYSQYSSPTEQVKTAAEGAAEALTFGASTGVERLLGVSPEAMKAREETNPWIHAAGQAGGLALSNLIPFYGEAADAQAAARAAEEAVKAGRITQEVAAPIIKAAKEAINPLSAQSVISGAGERAASAVGLGAPTSIVGRVGSEGAKMAVQSALLQSGDEVSRMFEQDPNQSAQTAMVDIGLSGLLGFGGGTVFGAVSPLWEHANGSKLGQTLAAIKNKANAIGGLPADPIDSLAENAGIELTPVMKAAVSKDPTMSRIFQELMEQPGVAAGRATQDDIALLHEKAKDAILNVLGKTKEELPAIEKTSDFEVGQNLQKNLSEELSKISGPISERFENYKKEFKGAELGETRRALIERSIGDLINEERLHVFPDLPQSKLVNDIFNGIKRIKTMDDLNKIQTVIGNETQDPKLWHIGKQLKSIFRNAEDDMTTSLLQEKAPALIGQHAADRSSYKTMMGLIDDLNDRLHVGSYGGPQSFVSKLKEMKPEDVLRRLSNKNDAGLLNLVEKDLPITAQHLKENHLNSLLSKSTIKGELNTKALFGELFDKSNAWSPELRKFALPKGAENSIGAAKELLQAIPPSMNPSHTAGTLDMIMSKVPAGLGSMISYFTGHGPITGFLMGHLQRIITGELPAAIKLATLKYLASNDAISSTAFKTAVSLISSTIKGQHMMNSAIKGVFDASKAVLPTTAIPSPKTVDKLDARVKKLKEDPKDLMNVGGQAPHYLPEHGMALGTVASNAVQYLNTIRPSTDKIGPLDPPRKPSEAEIAKYTRAVQIAQQPLMVLKHVQSGTLTSDDITTLKSIYPSLYSKLSEKLMNQAIEVTSKGQSIPYQTRLNLSMFLGQPLDATMSPNAILDIQKNMSGQSQQQAQQQAGPRKGSMKEINKLANNYMTPGQSREAHQVQKG